MGSLIWSRWHLYTDRWTAPGGGQRQRALMAGEAVQFSSRAPQHKEQV